jgi:ATP-dependent RNA helicase DDX55/SPB4
MSRILTCCVDKRDYCCLSLQVAFLKRHSQEKVIVYFLTCACVEYFGLVLKKLPALKGQQVACLHGKMKQAAREATLEKFSQLPGGKSFLRSI